MRSVDVTDMREVSDMTQLVRRVPWSVAESDPDVGRLLGRLFGSGLDPRWYRVLPLAGEDRWVPACDVFVRDGDLVVRMELPGVDPNKDVQVTVEDGVLCISGERRQVAGHDEGGYYRREWAYGGFQRGVPLPDTVVVDDIRASYDNGVLEVVVPKFAALSEPKRVPVDTAEANRRLTAAARDLSEVDERRAGDEAEPVPH
jgi:HSP20 family molecular chaperone IbpA